MPVVKKSPLRKALALIEDPKRWTQNVSARNEQGCRVDPDDPTAVSFCALGACDRAVVVNHESLRHASSLMGLGGAVSVVNDHSDHSTVLSMFDLAIALDEVGE